ncbi:MAG: hypothetical protein COY47_02910 [Chloroflexi bacterium CG_4_10_14_0_8_um_filter_57_5]|nr:MAG: hypothetical protein COS63_01145 [Anaerolineae bacterium CG06_land_8_20_14_3_00_57_67]PIW19721.1 MAG: hypothetical protein COW33_04590 [Anaerolineae bacterium CG17_big_fil_post_rev_8_21_14_2_50_57_27]PIZ25997.1 MAG: hypothetical protein COY47_02910 [Chloroflexi bacterium CG_4_10_14_0_8_um_filter_57_5]
MKQEYLCNACASLPARSGAYKDTILWLATLPSGGPSGGFFKDRKRIEWQVIQTGTNKKQKAGFGNPAEQKNDGDWLE